MLLRPEGGSMKAFALLGGAAVALVSSAGALAFGSHSEREGQSVRQIRDLSIELVGQFQNSPPGVTPPTHVHYGYVSYIRGVPVFSGAPMGEKTALFTFFSDGETVRVIPNGPLRVVTRIGTLTIYRDPSTNGDFARSESFRDGTPVLVARFRQQVVSNTITETFTTFHQNTITSSRPFSSGRRTVQLGGVGAKFQTYLSGHIAMPGPPSGFFGGYAVTG